MTPDELEDLAFQGASMPDLRSQSDILLFLSFRNLYDFANRVQMSPEQGRLEKEKILEAHRINKFLEDMQNETNAMWSKIEKATSDYNKAPSIENADLVIKAIYGVGRKNA